MMMMSPIANNNNTTMNATTMMVVGGVDRDDSTGSLNAAPSPVTTSTSVIAATAAAVVSAFPDFGSYDVPITARGSLLHKSASLSANSDTDADPYADIIASSPTDADDDDDDHGITDSEHDDPHRRTTASTRDSSLRSPPSTYQTSRVSSSSSSSSSSTPTPVSAPTTSPSIPPIVVQSASTPHLTGTLTVRVIGARKLYSHSPKHFMSPFCMVSLPPFLSSTSSHDRGDTQPHWDQQFVLQVQDCPVEEMFVCSVWDEKRKDDGLALLDIEIGKLMNPLYLGRHWFPLRHPVHADMVAGELELDVQWKGTAYEWPNLSPNPADFRVRVHKFAMASVSDVFAGEREAANNNKKGDVTSNDNNTAPVRSRDFRASDTLHPNQLRAGADAGAGAGSAAPHTADSSSTTTTTANKHLVDNRTGLTLIHEETVPDLYNNKLALSRPDGSVPPLLHSATTSFGIATMGPCGPGVAHVALPDQTFTLHDDRHLSSFLPPDTSLLTAAYGADHSIAVHSSPRYGLIYDDTTHFDDRNFLQHQAPSARIVEVRVWSREYIHGLQIVYKVGHEYRHTPRYMGKVHTTMHRFVLSDCGDEEIIAIRGTYKEWLETLTIVTNKRWKTFGGNVENRPKRWLPPGSEQAPVKFDLSLPAGHRVLGFFGGYGVHLHNLGVSYVPIVQQNSSRFGKCIVNVLKHKLARIGSVEFDAVSHEEGGGDHSPGVVSKQGSNGSGSKGVSTTVSGSGSGSSTSKSR